MVRLTARDLSWSLFGVWRLARLDPEGAEYFGNTPQAFWKSFWAAALVAPAYAVVLAMEVGSLGPDGPHPLRYVLLQCIAYVIGWVAFPLVMVRMSELLEAWGFYYRYIAAYNWFQVLWTLIVLPVSLILAGGALPPVAADLLSLLVLGVMLGYGWFIASNVLDLNGFTAIGVVVLDFVIGVFINAFFHAVA